MVERPDWWHWELEFSPHVLKRMLDRRFSEIDCRLMIEVATGFHRDYEEGRWVLETFHEGRPWEVIVEPAPAEQWLVVVTAYDVTEP